MPGVAIGSSPAWPHGIATATWGVGTSLTENHFHEGPTLTQLSKDASSPRLSGKKASLACLPGDGRGQAPTACCMHVQACTSVYSLHFCITMETNDTAFPWRGRHTESPAVSQQLIPG